MTTERYASPDAETFREVVRRGLNAGAVVTVYTDCEVEYDGRSGGTLGPGDRLVVCKRDGTLLVHRPTGHNPVNWQPAGGTVRVTEDGDTPTIYARRSNPNEYLWVFCREVYQVTRFDAEDAADYRPSGTEAEMHRYIQNNPEELEEGLRIVEHERETPYGHVDFFAHDADGTPVVVEVKRREATLNHFDQLQRYVSLYRESNPDARGMLVAPRTSDRVKRALRDHDLEFRRLAEFDVETRHVSETSLDDFV